MVTPMGGTFRVVDGALVFTPRHPFAEGVTYALLERDERGRPPMLITRPAPSRTPVTEVVGIYPTATELPMNALRFYVHFSAPMSEGFAADAVYLRDSHTGERLDGALLAMEPELWDPQRSRLTVLLDPGRIKRGLVPHTQGGYPLTPGRHVTFVVDARFQDAAGAGLTAGAERGYSVGPAVRRHVDPHSWTITHPGVRNRLPVRSRFDRPVDHALGLRCLSVVDAAGGSVPGRVELGPGEQEWIFTPDDDWGHGPYSLLIAPRLEDVAGNSVTRVFDRDLTDPDHDLKPPETIALPLTGSGDAGPHRGGSMPESTGWSPDELHRIGRADELGIASYRADASLRPYVTIWVVHSGEHLYVRSAYGTDNPWFRRAVASGAGRVRAGGLERGVVFTAPEAGIHEEIDAAYHAKYDRYGPAIVDTVVGADAIAGTLRLSPR